MYEIRRYACEKATPQDYAGYDCGYRYRDVLLRRNDSLKGALGHWSAVAGSDACGTFKVLQCRRLRDIKEEVDRWSRMYSQHSFFVHVTGDASDYEDEGVQGTYEISVELVKPMAWAKLSDASRTLLASKVLDCFHSHQAIGVLDDFEISVCAANGEVIDDLGEKELDLGLERSSFHGMVDRKIFEVAGFGFDGGDDETDDRILWVAAFHEEEVAFAIQGLMASHHSDIPLSCKPDFYLPEDREQLQKRLTSFL